MIWLTHIYINLYRKNDRDSYKLYTIWKRRSSLVRKQLLSPEIFTGIRSFWAPNWIKSDFFEVFSNMPCDTAYMVQMSPWLRKWSQILKIVKFQTFMARKLKKFEGSYKEIKWHERSIGHERSEWPMFLSSYFSASVKHVIHGFS